MKRLALSVFVAVMLICALVYANMDADVSQAQDTSFTLVNGVFNSNTTWTLVNSPYFLTAPVLVNTSVTLTIEPGVTVYLNETYLRVDGTLNAQGTSTSKISLIRNDTSSFSGTAESAVQFTSKSRSWNETSKTGSIISNAIASSAQQSASYTIDIDGCSPKITNCTVVNTGGQRSIFIDVMQDL